MHDIWHAAYCRWYDHDAAGHRIRAAIWGVVTDATARLFWDSRPTIK
jgi:hypothetical protein